MSPLEKPDDETMTIGVSKARPVMTAPTKDNHTNIAHNMLGMTSPGLALPWVVALVASTPIVGKGKGEGGRGKGEGGRRETGFRLY